MADVTMSPRVTRRLFVTVRTGVRPSRESNEPSDGGAPGSVTAFVASCTLSSEDTPQFARSTETATKESFFERRMVIHPSFETGRQNPICGLRSQSPTRLVSDACSKHLHVECPKILGV